MKISTLLMPVALCLISGSVKGADIDGKWKSYDMSIKGADIDGKWKSYFISIFGDTYFTFKADGKTLSGTMSYPLRDNLNITQGKISDDQFQFFVEVIKPEGDNKYTFQGTIKDDKIKLTGQIEFGPPKNSINTEYPNNDGRDPDNPNHRSASFGSNPHKLILPPLELLLKKVKE
jgi:hypothetical protein